MSSYVIGLTGGIACGKTNLSNALRAHGVPVVDADRISRALTAEGGEALLKLLNRRTVEQGHGAHLEGQVVLTRIIEGRCYSQDEHG
jgi:dephospho-CoA kinase